MKIIVTGAAGFIGSHLSEALVKKGYRVIGIDSFFNNYSRKIKRKNISNLLNSKRFTFINEDLIKTNFDAILPGTEYIFHLAAVPGVRTSWGKQFSKYLKNNLLATQIFLEQVKNYKIKKFVYSSSSSIYGDQDKLPISEDAPKNPISPYGVTKLAAEKICEVFASEFNVPIVCLRYFTVYGPRQRPDMAFHRFILNILQNKSIQVYGDGNQKRDYTYVTDVVKATQSAAFYEGNEIFFNIGGNKETSIKQILQMLKKITGKERIKVEYTGRKKGDMLHTYSDITKAVNCLDYAPQFSLEEGLKQQYLWMKSDQMP